MATRAIGEFELISAIKALAASRSSRSSRRGVRIGIGDDAAVLSTRSESVITTDALVEGVHFQRDWLSDGQLGARAYRTAASDIAAMGAAPCYVLLSLTIPTTLRSSEVVRCVRGLVEAAATDSCVLVGGNVSAGPVLSLTLTVVGTPGARILTRAGARAGDAIVVTGTLGDAAAGVELLGNGKRSGKLVNAFRHPPSRCDLASRLVRCKDVSAMLDVSDGLASDLNHLCEASAVAARVDTAAVPLSRMLRSHARSLGVGALDYAMRGEDYELLMTVGDGEAGLRRVERACKTANAAMTVIGSIISLPTKASRRARVCDTDGRSIEGGWDHLRAAAKRAQGQQARRTRRR